MTGQPPESLGQIGAIIMALFFIYCIFRTPPKRTISLDDRSWDMIPLGTITENRIKTNVRSVPKVPKVPKTEKAVKTVKVAPNTRLFDSCVEALVVLGCRRSEAKTKAINVFANEKVVDEQDFLIKAFKK